MALFICHWGAHFLSTICYIFILPKTCLHKVYTEEGGVKEHNKNQQAVGALKLAGAILIATKLLLMLDKIENHPIKALKERR